MYARGTGSLDDWEEASSEFENTCWPTCGSHPCVGRTGACVVGWGDGQLGSTAYILTNERVNHLLVSEAILTYCETYTTIETRNSQGE